MSTTTPSVINPLYSCKPDPADVLLQMFVSIGSRCLRCFKKAKPYSMVLCECGHFVCLDCFLICCFCDKQGVKGKPQLLHHHDKYKNGVVGRLNATDYIRSKSASTQIYLEGEKFQLECVFLDQPQATSYRYSTWIKWIS